MSGYYARELGSCESCGQDLGNDPRGDHEVWHKSCWSCWRGDAAEPDRRPMSSRTMAEVDAYARQNELETQRELDRLHVAAETAATSDRSLLSGIIQLADLSVDDPDPAQAELARRLAHRVREVIFEATTDLEEN